MGWYWYLGYEVCFTALAIALEAQRIYLHWLLVAADQTPNEMMPYHFKGIL